MAKFEFEPSACTLASSLQALFIVLTPTSHSLTYGPDHVELGICGCKLDSMLSLGARGSLDALASGTI